MQHGPGLHIGSMAKKLASFEVAFKGKRQVAEGTYEYTFEKPEGLHFRAGQHVRMSLINPPETDDEGDKRFFTMASTPQESDLVFAWRVRDTAFKRVADRLQPGDTVIIQKLLGESPKGSFVLHEDATQPAVFIVGGIGIVPAYAMVKDAVQRNLAHKIFLFYSNRRPEDAPYLNELQTIASQNPNVTLIATMTEPEKSAQGWQGETGLIDRVMLEKYVGNLNAPIYYVSGLPEMVNAMREVLSKANISKDTIRAEEFAGFKMGESGHEPQPAKSKSPHLLIAMIILIAIAMVAVHTSGMSQANLTELSFNNPLSYLLIAGLIAVVVFKVFVILKIKRTLHSKQGDEKLSVKDVLKAHKVNRKDK